MSFHFVRTRVDIALASAPWPGADALVLPTNDYLWMATGPALETKKLAGEEAELAAVRLGPIPQGQVVVAHAGSLPTERNHPRRCDGPGSAGRRQRGGPGPGPGGADGGGAKVEPHPRPLDPWPRDAERARRLSGATLAAIVDIFLDDTSLRTVTLLAENDAERSILHEAMMRIVQGSSLGPHGHRVSQRRQPQPNDPPDDPDANDGRGRLASWPSPLPPAPRRSERR